MNSLTQTTSQIDYLLVDCSSSMADKWIESIGALDTYIATLRAESVKSSIILHMFYDSNPDYIHRECSVADWTPLLAEYPEPQGTTPLYDAVNLMGRRLRLLDPPRAAITIVTDGDDTSGDETKARFARQVLDWYRAKGWQVTFIGADFSNANLAKQLGAQPSEAIGVQKRLLRDAAIELAKKRQRYGLSGAPMHWSESEQQQFGGYLSAPTPAGAK